MNTISTIAGRMTVFDVLRSRAGDDRFDEFVAGLFLEQELSSEPSWIGRYIFF